MSSLTRRGSQPPPPPSPHVRTGSSANVSSSGIAKLSLACKEKVACKGRAELFSTAPVRTLTAASRVRIGSTGFSIPAGRTKAVRIRLSRRGKQLMRENRRLRVQLVVTLRSSAGAKKVSRRITLIAARRR